MQMAHIDKFKSCHVRWQFRTSKYSMQTQAYPQFRIELDSVAGACGAISLEAEPRLILSTPCFGRA